MNAEPTPMHTDVTTVPSAASASRRRLMYGGAAAIAAAAGVGLGWWRLQPHAVAEGAEAVLWGSRFDTPTGGELRLAQWRGRPLLVNFWATWCPPCVEEMPLLDGFFRENSAKGWQVVGLAVDQLAAVKTFLARLPVSFPVGLAGLAGADLGKSLGNLTGGLPFTVVLGADGTIRHRRMGKVTADDLRQWAQLS